jgi:hypothetical protein
MITAAALGDNASDFFLGLAGSLLDASDQLILFAFAEVQFILRQARKSLLQFAFDDIPVSFGLKYIHTVFLSLILYRPQAGDLGAHLPGAISSLQFACRRQTPLDIF